MASHENMQEVAPGIWRPAIPLRAPWDVRWLCSHEWMPSDSMIEWRCLRCGDRNEGMPADGPYKLRQKIARFLFRKRVR